MGIGDAPIPVPSAAPINQPVPASGNDSVRSIDARLKVLERTSTAELVSQIRYLYGVLSEPYPPA